METIEHKITLETPVTRGKDAITEIILHKPKSGALRGVKLFDLLQSDVDAMMTVLPRVTLPSLTKTELMELDPADFLALAGEVISFLLPTSALSDSPQR